MITSRIRAALLGLLAMMLVGSVVVATASAEPGPFWNHRPIGGEGEGSKIEPKAPENVKGTGGVQKLKAKIGTTPILITSSGVQVKGAIFNGPDEGQFKLEIVEIQPELEEPELKGCTVVVGDDDIIELKAHLMWKWDGTEEQLEEPSQEEQTPDLVVSDVEPTQQSEDLDQGTLVSVTLSGTGCGILTGKFGVVGSDVAIPNRKLNEWSRSLSLRTLEPQEDEFLQHFWDGEAFKGIEIEPLFANNPAGIVGQTMVESVQQEIAIFEKS